MNSSAIANIPSRLRHVTTIYCALLLNYPQELSNLNRILKNYYTPEVWKYSVDIFLLTSTTDKLNFLMTKYFLNTMNCDFA